MCHSAWYAALIRAHLGPRSRANIIRWPYPIRPQPAGPNRAEHDVLIFDKSGGGRALVEAVIHRAYPRSATLRYGAFKRTELYELACRSRACVYLCDDESGGLATAEIMLAGCPVIGIERGAPFVLDGSTGIRVNELAAEPVIAGIRTCYGFDRQQVRAAALRIFDDERIVNGLILALDHFRRPAMLAPDNALMSRLGAPVETALA